MLKFVWFLKKERWHACNLHYDYVLYTPAEEVAETARQKIVIADSLPIFLIKIKTLGTYPLCRLGGDMVSVFAISPKVRGFKHGRGR
jgi:hypothetical protein